MTLLTFIIPVRHQDNAADWGRLKATLAQTIASIANQSHDNWRCVIVANRGADLPDLPKRFTAEFVDFPPNAMHEIGGVARSEFLDAFRIDKGRRVLAGMFAAQGSRYFMTVDDDDFVSSKLVRYVADHDGDNGWFIERGWVWNDGGSSLLKHDSFNRICGSCLVIRADLYALPPRLEEVSREFITEVLGSHYAVRDYFAARDAPLKPLPFRAAVYRVGNPGSHSQTPGYMRKYVFSKPNRRQPWRALRQLLKIRPLGSGARQEFFGAR